MQANFKETESVIISGTLTGIGDIPGTILEVEYSALSKEYFYQVKTDVKSYWCQERFLKEEEL